MFKHRSQDVGVEDIEGGCLRKSFFFVGESVGNYSGGLFDCFKSPDTNARDEEESKEWIR